MQPLVTPSNARRKAAAINTGARPCGSTAVRLKDRMRETIRTAGYSRRTFEAYWHWSAKFIRWAGPRFRNTSAVAPPQKSKKPFAINGLCWRKGRDSNPLRRPL